MGGSSWFTLIIFILGNESQIKKKKWGGGKKESFLFPGRYVYFNSNNKWGSICWEDTRINDSSRHWGTWKNVKPWPLLLEDKTNLHTRIFHIQRLQAGKCEMGGWNNKFKDVQRKEII